MHIFWRFQRLIRRLILPGSLTIAMFALFNCLVPVGMAQESYAPPHKVGGVLWLVGTVEDRAGAPLAGVSIALWQGDESGRYAHPSMAAAGPLRDDFQYFGSATSDAAGNFVFRSRVPGASAITGLVDLYIHLDTNIALKREAFPDENFGIVLYEAVRGRLPLLAPGSLIFGAALTWLVARNG